MKRWYQLSMLQLLVAMAVIAAVVTLNYPAMKPRQSFEANKIRDPELYEGFYEYDVTMGWPLEFYSGLRVGFVGDSKYGEASRYKGNRWGVRFDKLAVNAVVGIGTLAMSLYLTKFISNRN